MSSQGQQGAFDSVILACPGDLALELLRNSGAPATWKYRSACFGCLVQLALANEQMQVMLINSS